MTYYRRNSARMLCTLRFQRVLDVNGCFDQDRVMGQECKRRAIQPSGKRRDNRRRRTSVILSPVSSGKSSRAASDV